MKEQAARGGGPASGGGAGTGGGAVAGGGARPRPKAGADAQVAEWYRTLNLAPGADFAEVKADGHISAAVADRIWTSRSD